jgi:hypothetical protein
VVFNAPREYFSLPVLVMAAKVDVWGFKDLRLYKGKFVRIFLNQSVPAVSKAKKIRRNYIQ